MAALGFSVLMREWRRGMAFDPWHGSLYLNLSAAITLSSSFFCSYRWGETAAPQSNWEQGLKSTADSIINETRRGSQLIDHLAGKGKETETGL